MYIDTERRRTLKRKHCVIAKWQSFGIVTKYAYNPYLKTGIKRMIKLTTYPVQ